MAESRNRSEWTRFSPLLALTANAHRDPKKKSSPFSISDFDPYAERREIKDKRTVTMGELKRMIPDLPVKEFKASEIRVKHASG